MAYSILFVCLGNICRSPSAEAVVRVKAAQRGINLTLDSAGTGDWHAGEPPYGPMIKTAKSAGYDLSDLRARQVRAADSGFDLVVAMDADNRADLGEMLPGVEVRLFTDFAPDSGADAVPDPYFTRDFAGALRLIEACADGLLDAVEAGQV